MNCFQRLREENPIVRFLVRAQSTVYYPILFAALCVCSGLGNRWVYVPILWLLTAAVVFSALFSEDSKPLLVPIMLAYYALGSDAETTVYNDISLGYLQSFRIGAFVQICICGVVMASALIYRLARDGSLKRAFQKRGLCTSGFLAIGVTFLCNGIFSARHRPIDLLYGVLCSVAMILIYFVVLSVLDSIENPIPYVCKCMVCVSYVALLQFLVIYLRLYSDGVLLTYVESWKAYRISREYMNLPWGISTIVGAVIALGIPAAMYLARSAKYPFISYPSALLFFVGTFLVDTRSAILVGGVIFVASAWICCAGGPNKWFNRVFTLFIPVAALIVLMNIGKKGLSFRVNMQQLMALLRFINYQHDGRHTLFSNALQDFKSAPIFGVGFADGAYLPETAKNNLFSNMYHNIVLQVLASVGLVGALGFFIHLRNVGELAVRRFTSKKLLLLFLPMMILSMSLVDNFFFYPNFQILYSIFLVLAELELEQLRKERLQAHKVPTNGEKPRVLFAYVEAGMGHIIPEEAVRKCFAEKYGEETDIIVSNFYNETNDPNLKKIEELFVKTVQNQNKNFVAGALCRLATLLFGDAWSLYWVMACTPSGIKSYRRAMKRLEELDCHLLFTTHWSLAFYASHMKNPPYCVLLCPDPYSNEMFNTDVNCLLLPTKEGKLQVDRQRLYAGGNVQQIAPPIRSEAKQSLDQRDELRKKHGVPTSSFTVTIMDGGYGMARMEKTVMRLLRSKEEMTLIALCGKNKDLQQRLEAITPPENIRLTVLGYCENSMEYIAMADLFCGKAGANSLAEAAYFGVPILVNKCATYIERHTKNYYTKKVKGAVYLPSAVLAASFIQRAARNPRQLERYQQRISALKGRSGEEAAADLLYRAACPAHGTVSEAKNAEPSVFSADLPAAPQNTTEVTD